MTHMPWLPGLTTTTLHLETHHALTYEQKVKLKLGKKKAPAENHTDTSFKSQSIVLTKQNLHTESLGGQATNSRNLSLTDLIPQLKHYSGVVRRDALKGLADLLTTHPHVLVENVGTVVNSLARLFVDDEPVIRKAVRRLCHDHLRHVPESKMAAFYPTILAYVCSAMTHIDEDIRIDGLRLLNTWVELLPGYMARHRHKLLPIYLDMLRLETRSKAGATSGVTKSVNSRTQNWSQNVRIEVMSSLLAFLRAVSGVTVGGDSGDTDVAEEDYWFFEPEWQRRSIFSGATAQHARRTTYQEARNGHWVIPTPYRNPAALLGADSGGLFSHLNLFG
ncbi:rRNA processing protein, partial [Tieghemiomyces parasiticus]